MIREFLTAGRYRYWEAIILFAAFEIMLYHHHGEYALNTLSNFFKAATFILTSMGLVAYNLRNKVMDNILKMMDERTDFEKLGDDAINCGRNLTDIVILSIFSLGATYIVSTLPKGQPILLYVTFSVAALFFILCSVLYIHVLLSFDRLEQGILNNKIAKRKTKIQEKRLEYIQKGKEEYPDN